MANRTNNEQIYELFHKGNIEDFSGRQPRIYSIPGKTPLSPMYRIGTILAFKATSIDI